MGIARLGHDPGGGHCLIDGHLPVDAAGDRDDCALGRRFQRAQWDRRPLARRGDQHAGARSGRLQRGHGEPVHRCLEGTHGIQFHDGDAGAERRAEARAAAPHVAVADDDDAHARHGRSHAARVNEIEDRRPARLTRPVGVVEQGLRTRVVRGHDRNAQVERTQGAQPRGGLLRRADQRVQDARAGLRVVRQADQVGAVIQEEFAALSQKLARELPLALAGGCRVREDGDAGVAQAGRDVLAGLGRPAEDAHARPGLGEHEGQGGRLRLQDEGQPHASARHQGSQGACRRLGDRHVGTGPLDTPLVAGARDGAPVGGDDGAEDAAGRQDRDRAGPRGRVLLEREDDWGRGRGPLGVRQRAHVGAEGTQQGGERRVVRREGTPRDEHVRGPRVGA